MSQPWITDVDTIRRQTRWPDVRMTEESESDSDRGVLFRICPSDDALSSIDLRFDESVQVLHALYFDDGHCHFEKYADERKNVRSALAVARQLVGGRLCVVDALDKHGKSLGGTLERPEAIPQWVNKKAHSFRRMFFGKAATVEPVDHAQYERGEHLLTLRAASKTNGVDIG